MPRSRPLRYRFRFYDETGVELSTDLMPTIRGLKAFMRDARPGVVLTVTDLATGRLIRAYGLLNGEPQRLGPH